MKRSFLFFSFVFFTTVTFTSCKWKKINQEDLDAAEDIALAENLFSDAFKQVGDAASSYEDSLKSTHQTLSGCGTLTISPLDTVTWPKTVTLDFGPVNCMGSDYRNRRGIIQAQFTDWWRETGCVVTVTFNNYYVNDNKIEGTKIITNQGRNASNNLVYDVEFPNCTITKPDNGVITWHTSREHEWIEGENTFFNPYDDVYLIRGSAGGTSALGVPYTFQTVTDLNVLVGCRWIRAGELNFNIGSVPTIGIDFGDGACDWNAVVIYEGNEYDIIMQ